MTTLRWWNVVISPNPWGGPDRDRLLYRAMTLDVAEALRDGPARRYAEAMRDRSDSTTPRVTWTEVRPGKPDAIVAGWVAQIPRGAQARAVDDGYRITIRPNRIDVLDDVAHAEEIPT
jgi:hypothetical protein